MGSLPEFLELLALAREGRVKSMPNETRPLDAAQQSPDDLRAGRIRGRIVLASCCRPGAGAALAHARGAMRAWTSSVMVSIRSTSAFTVSVRSVFCLISASTSLVRVVFCSSMSTNS